MTEIIATNQKAKEFFEKTYGKKLTEREVSEYKNRLVKFFALLMEIDRRSNRKSNETKNN